MKKILLLLAFTFGFCFAQAQVLQDSIDETDPAILNSIEKWKDLKFGFMMHWGIYSQWGVVESWSVCNEPWIDRKGANYEQYKHDYFSLNRTFNPQHFDAKKWAEIAQKTGTKYVVFTTKHHDGFCMFDTKQTSYSVTDTSCPYSVAKQPDITKSVVDAFRAKDFLIGLYFSKPDWHDTDYWCPLWATPDRNVNYDINQHKDMWQRYCDYTFNQLKELTHNYGKVDVLWLDGGWVRPEWSLNSETEGWLGCYKRIQDVNMPRIAQMAREKNPSMLIVDRSVGGKYENYRTPEQQVPDTVLPYPWETCMTMGDSWSWVPNDNYKSVNKLLHILVDVVAKGGNFLLNVGPDKDGVLPTEAVKRMEAMGERLKVNGGAIYSTRPVYPYKSGKLCFTQGKDKQIYAIYLLDEKETLPKEIAFQMPQKLKTGSIAVKGTNKKAKLQSKNNSYKIIISKFLQEDKALKDAVVFCL